MVDILHDEHMLPSAKVTVVLNSTEVFPENCHEVSKFKATVPPDTHAMSSIQFLDIKMLWLEQLA